MLTIAEMKELNEEAGFYFFSPGAMRFFNSEMETQTTTREGYFITSEHRGDDIRRFTIRLFDLETSDVHTVGAFMEFATLEDAIDAMIEVARCS
ncbi:DUF7447 family protein [Shouchella lonarensis]|uniref:Uncharacterized protein n=1 Tax=Shouchella lonarensis TaxID=1464122 RepID=A0A1G6HM00_9BACI|nr:hypothetical protein [Shouchella lonarensis]SDB95280.1 hypothetical protein SAMN05421737_10471 [Shouchella lonarensis]